MSTPSESLAEQHESNPSESLASRQSKLPQSLLPPAEQTPSESLASGKDSEDRVPLISKACRFVRRKIEGGESERGLMPQSVADLFDRFPL